METTAFHDRAALFEIVRDSWIEVLDLDEDGTDEPLLGTSNFFSFGGDSSLARDLCGTLLQDHSIRLTSATVFQHPTLDGLVDVIIASSAPQTSSAPENAPAGDINADIPPFSLLPEDDVPASQESARVRELAAACGLDIQEIEDAYPCTALQEGLVSLSQRDEGSYWASHVYKLDSDETLTRFASAWDQVIQAYPILRTSIAQTQAGALFQVVSRSRLPFETVDTELQSFLQDTSSVANTINAPLSRFSVVRNGQDVWFVWRIHHAAFDAASIRLILAGLEQVWHGQAVPPSPPYKAFIAETLSYSPEDAGRFWSQKLEGVSSCVLPYHASKTSAQASFATEVRRIDLGWQQRGSVFSLPTILHAAWSLVLARHAGVDEITYGAVLSSREAQWQAVAAPIISTIPVRLPIAASESVADFLSRVQSYMADAMPHAHIGLQKIAQLGSDMEAACSFQSLMVAQPAPARARDAATTPSTLPPRNYVKESGFHSYDITVEAYIGSSDVEVKLHHHEGKIPQAEAQRLLRHYEYAAFQLTKAMGAESSPSLSTIDLCGPEDLEEIQSFNSQCPKPESKCIHELVSRVAHDTPRSAAIAAHDAPHEFTHAQLDAAASALARKLVASGIQPGQRIPLLFEKSIWAVVAMLAVLKAGAAFVPLEWTQPLERLQKIVAQVHAAFIITSSRNEALASSLEAPNPPVVVAEPTLAQLEQDTSSMGIELPRVQPTDLAYIVFTSGSTGVPKGVTISHQAFCTSAAHHGPALGFTSTSRVLQFSSYSFDVSIAEMFTTLIAGGCVCIATEEERLHNLPDVLRRMRVSVAVLTPTVFEHFPVEEASGDLKTVILTGDSSSQQLVDRWASRVVLMNAYGPSESSVWAYTHHFGEFSSSNNIGLPRGCIGWIVDPEDIHKLAPVGCAGELLLQGPILSDGYLQDPEKTKSSFVSHLAWQQDSDERLYRTGDLARQSTDGSVYFLGRRDTQVKIRGQRVEISDIENHVRELLPNVVAAAVEIVFRVENDPNSKTLVAFCSLDSEATASHSGILRTDDHTEAFLRLRTALSSALPSYMVPQAYVPVTAMPMGVSGKVDRKKLRSALAGVADDQWRSYLLAGDYEEADLSPRQATLRGHWASCLNIQEDSIRLQDSFFRLGGTSILAMRLSSLCRQNSVALSVSDVFKNPTLEAMTAAAQFQDGPQAPDTRVEELVLEPFSLLPLQESENEQVRDYLARFTGIDMDEVEDAYPATPLQEGLIAATQAEPEAYILHRVHSLQGDVKSHFLQAWTQVVRETAILRTRLVQTPRWGLVQVVTRAVDLVETSTSLDLFISQERARSVALGEPLNRYAVVTDPAKGDFFVWQAHHAGFDGWTLKLIYERFLQVYKGTPDLAQPVQFRAFVHGLEHLDMTKAGDFWQRRLEGCKPLDFPRSASRKAEGAENRSSALRFPIGRQWRKDCDFTLSTLLNAAWSLVLATHTDSDDIVFGTTLSGRAAPIASIEKIPGPTMTTVPVRLRIEETKSLHEFLVDVQTYLSDVVPYEQYGLLKIRALGPGPEAACTFRTLLLLQPREDAGITGLHDVAPRVELTTASARYQTYDIALEVLELGEDLELRMNYNIHCLEPTEASWLLSHVKAAMRMLTTAATAGTLAKTAINEVNLFSSEDQQQLREWNEQIPLVTERCIHDVISETAVSHPSVEAIRAWDGSMTYKELDDLSSRLAHHLIHKTGVKPAESVILCFEKSRLTVVAMLAVLKAGATMVPVEWSHPQTRLEEISQGVQARHALTVEKHAATCASLGLSVEVISPELLTELSHAPGEAEANPLPPVSPAQIAYVIFTSGSTGKPKGIPVRHEAFSTTTSRFGDAYRLSASSRVFHFASYAYDVSLMETLIPLCYGAAVCIPHEQGRKDNLAGTFTELEANYTLLGPGVVATLDVRAMAGLRVLVLGGEAVPEKMLQEWGQTADVVIAYGSTECAAVDHAIAIPRGTKPPPSHGGLLGRSIGSVRSWVVSANDHSRLAPLGCNGELLIEGPVVGDGYINEEAKTRSHFIPAAEVSWLDEYSDQPKTNRWTNVYKTGDIVRYNADGNLSYIGRKDLRIKIRGQRVEMGGIEVATRRALPELVSCAAELVQVRHPGSASEVQMLAIFACFPNMHQGAQADGGDFLSHDNHDESMLLLQGVLSSSLPSHMVPELFVPVRYVPTAASGKVDRKKLQTVLLSVDDTVLSRYQLSQNQTDGDELPATETEKVLQGLWADCLSITDKGAISRQSHFLRMGGNSIAAMRLTALAREHELTLTVVDILKNPVLSDMAEAAAHSLPGAQQAEEEIAPFSLICNSADERETLVSRIAAKHSWDAAEIEDVYPCTPLQEGLVALTHVKPKEYIAHHVFQISNAFGLGAIRSALQSVVAANPIFRTCIIEDSELLQVVTKGSPVTRELNLPVDLALARMQLQEEPPILGRPFSEFCIVQDEDQNCNYLIWKTHHAAYDGWTVLALADQLRAVLADKPRSSTQPFNRFIAHLKRLDRQAGSNFWKAKLEGATPSSFPRFEGEPLAKEPVTSTISESVVMPIPGSLSYTFSTVLHAAWAFTLAKYAMASEVTFGTVLSGRNAAVAGIDQVMGATVATIPLRVQLSQGGLVTGLLDQVHGYMADATPFEQMGLQHIRRLSQDAEKACDFDTLLVVQPLDFALKEEDVAAVQVYRPHDVDKERTRTPGTYKLTLECLEKRDGLDLRLHFNASAVSPARAEWVARHFARTVEQMLKVAEQGHATTIANLDIVGPGDLAAMQVAQEHVSDNLEVRECVHTQVWKLAEARPQRNAVDAWDGRLSYQELASQSQLLSHRLFSRGMKPEEPVILCIDKSKFFPIAALAVLAAGGTIVPVDATHPKDRLRVIAHEAGATKCLCTENTSGVAEEMGLQKFEVSALLRPEDNVEPVEPLEKAALPDVDPQSLAYIIFTSGSTGTPKGVLISHASLSTSSRQHSEAYEITSRSRVLHFASYAFDVSLAETLTTLLVGGCVCIPSNNECRDDLAAAMERYRVSVALLTPSVVSVLRPQDVSHLTTLVLGGERHTPALRETWQRHCHVVNGYGPAECAISVTSTPPTSIGQPTEQLSPGDIGVLHRSVAAWVADPADPNRLVPFGCVGELLIGGPQVARGYLDRDGEKTAKSFLENLEWMRHLGRSQRVYRTGDLVHWAPAGHLILVGRRDDQVKVRGQRLELGDVEAHLQKSFAALQTIAVVPKAGPLEGSLVVLLTDSLAARSAVHHSPESLGIYEALLSEEYIRAQFQQFESSAPPAMVPSLWIPVKSFPLSSSGKVDRKSLSKATESLSAEQVASIRSLRYLSEDTDDSTLQGSSAGDISSLEIIQRIMAEVLQVPESSLDVDAGASFTMLGGDSIRAMVLSSRLREAGVYLKAIDILQAKSLASLWGRRHVTKARRTPRTPSALQPSTKKKQMAQPPSPSPLFLSSLVTEYKVEIVLPCSAVQSYMFRSSQRNPVHYRASSIVRVSSRTEEPINETALAGAWSEVVRNHPLLRSVFLPTDGGVYLAVLSNFPGSLRCIGQHVANHEEAISLLKEQAGKPFARDTPQYHVSYCKLADSNDMFVMFDMHHALADGASMSIILRDWAEAYMGRSISSRDAFLDGREAHNPASSPVTSAPSKATRPFPRSNSIPDSQSVDLEDILVSQLLKSSHLAAFTLSTIIQAAWALTMHDMTGDPTPEFGVLLTQRRDDASSSTVGPLFDIYTQQFDVVTAAGSAQGVKELLTSIQEQTWRLVMDEDAASVASASRKHMSSPIRWNTLVNMRSSSGQPKGREGTEPKPSWEFEYLWATDPMDHDVVVSGLSSNGTLRLSLNYYQGVTSKEDISRAAQTVTRYLRVIAELE